MTGDRGEPGVPFAKESALSSSTGVINSSPTLEDLLKAGVICVLTGKEGIGGTGGTGSSLSFCTTGVLSLASSDFSASGGETADRG